MHIFVKKNVFQINQIITDKKKCEWIKEKIVCICIK